MGNQREIRQVFPTAHLGAAVPIRPGQEPSVDGFIDPQFPGRFYTAVAPADAPFTIYNMDFDSTVLPPAPFCRLIIKSGGKMWCGYDNFCRHIADLAPFLADALFFVGDEEDYIDEFSLRNGALTITRVHEGYWWPVDDYLQTRFPAQPPDTK